MSRKLISIHLLLLILIASFGPVLQVHACGGDFKSFDLISESVANAESASCCCEVSPVIHSDNINNKCCDNFNISIKVATYQTASSVKTDFSTDVFLLWHPAPTFIVESFDFKGCQTSSLTSSRFHLPKKEKLFKWHQNWKFDC